MSQGYADPWQNNPIDLAAVFLLAPPICIERQHDVKGIDRKCLIKHSA